MFGRVFRLATTWMVTITFAVVFGSALAPPAFGDPIPIDYSYQGRLADNGTPYNGTYDIRFQLYTTPTGSGAIGSPSWRNIDPCTGSPAPCPRPFEFDLPLPWEDPDQYICKVAYPWPPDPVGDWPMAWNPIYLEVAVKRLTDQNYTVLDPRQELMPTPLAISAIKAGRADSLKLPFTASVNTSLPAMALSQGGGGPAARFEVLVSPFVQPPPPAVEAISHTSAPAISATNTWGGPAGFFVKPEPEPYYPALQAISGGAGSGLEATSASGNGVWGISTTGRGVLGTSTAFTGVKGESTNWLGVAGVSSHATGVYGLGLEYAGVRGDSDFGDGVIGLSTSANGVSGHSEGGAGIYGSSTNGLAGSFAGAVHVSGTLSKAAGSFKIDHPLDPGNKYLLHSFVESPDMMNVYNGNVTLDVNAEAWVDLPDWFDTLNKDFRYQLTAIGAPAPNLHVGQKISGNRFQIAGGQPGLEVSWQVTGIRNDAYAQAHRIPVEQDKSQVERGHFLHPELYGASRELSVNFQKLPALDLTRERPFTAPRQHVEVPVLKLNAEEDNR